MGTMEAVAAVHDLLERVVEGLGLPGPVEVRIEDETMYGVVHGEDLGLFIGRHGATIDAVQHLAHRLVLRNETELRVVVDAEGYRDRRRTVLEQQADRAADEAVRVQAPGRAGRHDRDGAQARARVPARRRRHRDLQRGAGAGSPPRGRPDGVLVARFT